MSEETTRSELITWDDPQIFAEASAAMDGLTMLQAMRDGEIPTPPIGKLLDFYLTKVDLGRVEFVLQPGEKHYSPIRTVHGGVTAAILDAAMACAILTHLQVAQASTTLELHLNYIRPILKDTGHLTATANVLHVGRRTATAEAKLTNSDGKLFAHATTTCLIFENPA